MMSMMGGGMMLTMVLWILIVGFIIYGIIRFLIKQNTKKENTSLIEKRGDSSVDVLRERFARGEIDKQEFEDRKEILQNK